MGISSLRKNIVRAIICDHCQKTAQAPFFQCNICHAGDYDICLACYDGSSHCHERDNLLVELKEFQSWTIVGKYYSYVKSSGNKDVIEL